MKTPREILLARHQSANAKLDEIRRATIETSFIQATAEQNRLRSFAAIVHQFVRQFRLPKPAVWAPLAAVWILILVLRLSTQDSPRVNAANVPISAEVIAEVREQKRFYADLIGVAELRAATPPKLPFIRPRSERQFDLFAT